MCGIKVTKEPDAPTVAPRPTTHHHNSYNGVRRVKSNRGSRTSFVEIRHPSDQLLTVVTKGHGRTSRQSVTHRSRTELQQIPVNGPVPARAPSLRRIQDERRSTTSYVTPADPKYRADAIIAKPEVVDFNAPRIVHVSPTPARSPAHSPRQSQLKVMSREQDPRASGRSINSHKSHGSRRAHSRNGHGGGTFVFEETRGELARHSSGRGGRRESSPGPRPPGRVTHSSMHRPVSVTNRSAHGGSRSGSRSHSRERRSDMFVSDQERDRMARNMETNRHEVGASDEPNYIEARPRGSSFIYGQNPRMSGGRLAERHIDIVDGRRRESYM